MTYLDFLDAADSSCQIVDCGTGWNVDRLFIKQQAQAAAKFLKQAGLQKGDAVLLMGTSTVSGWLQFGPQRRPVSSYDAS